MAEEEQPDLATIQSGDEDVDDDQDIDHDDMIKKLMKNSKYGGTEEGKYQWQSKRTGIGREISELAMTKSSKTKKLRLSQLLKASKNTEAKRKLRNFEEKAVLDAPLKKPLAKKAARRVNFEEVKEEISKYDPIVKEIRHADQLIFPRNDTKVHFNVAAQFETSRAQTEEPKVEAVEAKKKKKKLTPLEQEITEQLILNEENVEFDNRPLTENELAILKSKSIEEARALHREIQRRRLLTSFQEAKFRRLRRIKSKKYHRILKKEKLKKTIEEFDQIVDQGAEGAEEKLAELDRLRALERASLKHHITGKWAKYNKLRAKYDDSARDELNKQMALNAELMKKRSLAVLEEFDGGEGDEEQEGEVDFGGATKATEEIVVPNDYNPWISTVKAKKANKKVKIFAQSAAEEAIPTANDENSLKRFFEKRIAERIEAAAATERREVEAFDALDERNLIETTFGAADEDDLTKLRRQRPEKDDQKLTTSIEAASSGDESSDEEESTENSKRTNVNLKLDNLLVDLDTIKKKDAKLAADSGIDEQLHDSDDEHLMGEFDFHNSDMQKYLREAFHDDDVVQEFLKEKKEKEAAERGPTVSTYMPGWGNWAGSGIRETKRKRQRQVRQVVKRSKRLDAKIANAIILNEVEEVGAKYKIAFKPPTISNVKNFEATLSKPIGSNWNPQTVFKSMTAPKVITKSGAIIEPMESSIVKDQQSVKSATLKARQVGKGKSKTTDQKSQRKPLR